jgi:hypothetical protein
MSGKAHGNMSSGEVCSATQQTCPRLTGMSVFQQSGKGRQTNRQKDISRLLRDKNRQQKEKSGSFPIDQNKKEGRKGGKHG